MVGMTLALDTIIPRGTQKGGQIIWSKEDYESCRANVLDNLYFSGPAISDNLLNCVSQRTGSL
jgi:hypothetical protein